jgi:hypothetical protein
LQFQVNELFARTSDSPQISRTTGGDSNTEVPDSEPSIIQFTCLLASAALLIVKTVAPRQWFQLMIGLTFVLCAATLLRAIWLPYTKYASALSR